MAAVLKHWREASTLILVAERHKEDRNTLARAAADIASDGAGGEDFDVLLLKRSGKSGFMPNLYVFPGGVAEDADFSPDWIDIFDTAGTRWREEVFAAVQAGGAGTPMFSRSRPEQFQSIPSEIGFRLCAIRETFEESGILLARRSVDMRPGTSPQVGKGTYGNALLLDDELNEWRERVTRDAGQFIAMCRQLALVPDVEALYEWSNWLTPVSPGRQRGRRYDTAFFLCSLATRPDASHDDAETTHSQWGAPADFLRHSVMEEVGVAPPQRYELARLLAFPNLTSLGQFCSSQLASHRVQLYLPVIASCPDALLTLLPGDDLYPLHPDLYGEEPPLQFEETEAELMKKHPRMHRSVIRLSAKTPQERNAIVCTIRLPHHVAPVTDKVFPSANL